MKPASVHHSTMHFYLPNKLNKTDNLAGNKRYVNDYRLNDYRFASVLNYRTCLLDGIHAFAYSELVRVSTKLIDILLYNYVMWFDKLFVTEILLIGP